MAEKNSLLNPVENLSREILHILELCKAVPSFYDPPLKEYEKICTDIPEHIHSGFIRIAVAGAIKSGKSTFVNSLAGKEIVQRGAGVVTSVTTRIRKGRKNRAVVYLRSWDDINLQLQNALELFPFDMPFRETDRFDLRRSNDRQALEKACAEIQNDVPVTREGIRPEALLIKHALDGFDTCRDMVQADETQITFESRQFDHYKPFVSDPGKAFYVKDVCLNVYGNKIDPGVEIADCQGTDSADPGQLEKILSYIETCNVILYCISSRTGVRQADIVFLNRIKKLGLLKNIVFINNCDLTEHENLENLLKVEQSIHEDLNFMDAELQIFSFSCLFNLFAGQTLDRKAAVRMELWRQDKAMAGYSSDNTEKFKRVLDEMLKENRSRYLVSNPVRRLGIIISGVRDKVVLFSDLLSSDREKADITIRAFENLEKNAANLAAIVEKSIEASVDSLKDSVRAKINALNRKDKRQLLKKMEAFIRNAPMNVEKYRSAADESSFRKILYFLFQDFKTQFDMHIVDSIRPEIIQFINELEKEILSFFKSLYESFHIDILQNSIDKEFLPLPELSKSGDVWIDIETIKKISGLRAPLKIAEAKYTPRIKADVLTSFGVHACSQILFALFNRRSKVSFSPSLDRAAAKIRSENIKLLKEQFQNYCLSLENQYFNPLIEAVKRDFKEKTQSKFKRYSSYKEEAVRILSLKKSEKNAHAEQLAQVKEMLDSLTVDLKSLLPS